MGTRLHLCIRPIRGSFLLLANIVVSSQRAIYIEAIVGPVGAEASVCDGLTKGQCSLAGVGALSAPVVVLV